MSKKKKKKNASRKTDEAKLHLTVYGQPRVVEMTVHVGDDCTPLDLWQPARVVSESITAATMEKITAENKRISCAAGCGACCRQLVTISPLEATALLEVVEQMPEERRKKIRARFDEALRKMEDVGLLPRDAPKGRDALLTKETEAKAQWHDISRRYWALQIACPFLENESCGIYEHRPMICREYHVTTPKEYCQTLDERTRGIPWPVRMSEVLAVAGGRIAGISELGIPFALALEWAEAHGDVFRVRRDGEQMFWTLVKVIEQEWEG